jgi:hypothetical protein
VSFVRSQRRPTRVEATLIFVESSVRM